MTAGSRGRARAHASALAATVVSAGFAYLAVRSIDLDELGSSLRDSDDWWWLAPAFAVFALAFFLRVLRWRALFSPETRPPLWPTTHALLLSHFFNSVLPLRAGDAARIVVLHSLVRRSRAETAATVLVERLFDVLALLFLLFAALPWLPTVTWVRAAGLLALTLTVALVAAIVVLRVYGDRAVRVALRPLRRLPMLDADALEAAARNLTHGFVGLRNVHLGLLAFGWTVASWLVLAVSFWLVMPVFDLGLSPAAGLLTVIATGLSLILPAGPAGVGVFEAAGLLALVAYGVRHEPALSYALVVHALNVLPYIAAGGILLTVGHGVGAARPAVDDARDTESLRDEPSGARDARPG